MKRFWIVFFFLIVCASCTNQQVDDELVVPTQTVTPVPKATSTPIVVWEQALPDYTTKPVPYSDLEVITVNNVQRLEEIDRWGKGWVDGVALSPDGKTIAVSTGTGILFYDAHSMEQIKKFSFCETVNGKDCKESVRSFDNIDFYPDGKSIVIGRDAIYELNLDSMELLELVSKPEKHGDSRIVEVQFNQDSTKLVVVRYYVYSPEPRYASLEIYEMTDMSLMFEYEFQLADDFSLLNFSKNNTVQYRGLEVNLENGKILSKSSGPYPRREYPIEGRGLDNRIRAISSRDHSTNCEILIDASTSSPTTLFDVSQDERIAVIFATGGSSDLLVFDFNDCTVNYENISFPEPDRDIGFSPDGNYIITGDTSGRYKYIWDVNNGSVALPVEAESISFNKDETEVYAVVDCYPDNGKFVNIMTNEVFFEIDPKFFSEYIYQTDKQLIVPEVGQIINLPSEEIVLDQYWFRNSYFVHPDETLFLYTNWECGNFKENEIDLQYIQFGSWEALPDLDQKIMLPENTSEYPTLPNSINISSSWNYFAFFYDCHIYVWNLVKQEMVSISKEIEYVTDDIKFSPDETLFYTTQYGGDESQVQIWEVKTGKELYRFNVPLELYAYSIAICPDGKLLAFLANDGTIRIYGVRSEAK